MPPRKRPLSAEDNPLGIPPPAPTAAKKSKPSNLNTDLIQALRRELETLQTNQPHNKIQYAYAKAIRGLNHCQFAVTSYELALKVEGVGPFVGKKIAELLNWPMSNSQTVVAAESLNSPASSPSSQSDSEPPLQASQNGKKKAARPYIPRPRAGAWAILIALLEEFEARNGLMVYRKEDVIRLAQPHCDTNMTPAGQDYYAGWSSMKTLSEKGLCKKEGNPPRYGLTEAGLVVAQSLANARSAVGNAAPARTNSTPAASQSSRSTFGGSQNASFPYDSEDVMTATYPRRQDQHHAPNDDDDDFEEEPDEIQLSLAERLSQRVVSSQPQSNGGKGVVNSLPSSLNYPSFPATSKAASVPSALASSSSSSSLSSSSVASVTGSGDVLLDCFLASSEDSRLDISQLGDECFQQDSSSFPPSAPIDPDRFIPTWRTLSANPVTHFCDLKMLLDSREKRGNSDRGFFYTELFQAGIPVERRALDLGDICWVVTVRGVEYMVPYICERKTMADLEASIKDGRYMEQKARLRRCGLNQIIYLLEGRWTDVPDPGAMMTAAMSTQGMDGFHVRATKSAKETVDLLIRIHRMILVSFCAALSPQSVSSLMTYDAFADRSSKSKHTRFQEVFRKQIATIKGCSAVRADIVVEKHATPAQLFAAYQRCPATDRDRLVSALRRGSLAVGPRVSKKLAEVFTARVYSVDERAGADQP